MVDELQKDSRDQDIHRTLSEMGCALRRLFGDCVGVSAMADLGLSPTPRELSGMIDRAEKLGLKLSVVQSASVRHAMVAHGIKFAAAEQYYTQGAGRVDPVTSKQFADYLKGALVRPLDVLKPLGF